MGTTVLTLEGVLRRTGNQLDPKGRVLYEAFTATTRTVILTAEDRLGAEWFLRTNNMMQHADLISVEEWVAPDEAGRFLRAMDKVRAPGVSVDSVIVANPETAEALFSAGFPVLLYAHPIYTVPSFRPDYKSVAKPWNKLTETMEFQRNMKAAHSLSGEPL